MPSAIYQLGVRTIAPEKNCLLVGVRIRVIVGVRVRVGGQFSLEAIVLGPSIVMSFKQQKENRYMLLMLIYKRMRKYDLIR